MSLDVRQPFKKKFMAIIQAAPGMSPIGFKEYYEGPHAALLRDSIGPEIAAGRVLYRRNFLTPVANELSLAPLPDDAPHLGRPFKLTQPASQNAGHPIAGSQLRVGCVTELGFLYEEDYDKFLGLASKPEYVRRAHETFAGHVAEGSPQSRLVECWDSAGTTHKIYSDDKMAVKIFGFVPPKPGISRENLISHYETSHTKLLQEAFEKEILDGSFVYRRNYLIPRVGYQGIPAAGIAAVDSGLDLWARVASITECAFRNAELYERFKRLCSDPQFIERRDMDEERYKDPGGTLVYSVDSCSW